MQFNSFAVCRFKPSNVCIQFGVPVIELFFCGIYIFNLLKFVKPSYNVIAMRIFVLLTCFIWLCLPSLAWKEKAADVSLQYLNDSVYSKIPTFKQSLYNDYSEIQRIINLYKQNSDLIKTNEINSFGMACKNRNQTLLSVYENEFFKPAYNKYLQSYSSLTYEDWKHSVALSEASLFYDFYTFTEANLRDCEKIVLRSTSH